MRQIMGGTHAAKSRRNLTHIHDREIWEQARSEDHTTRYKLYCKGGAYNLRCDLITLLAEMGESKPYMIERIPAGRTGQEGLAAATQLHGDSLRSCSPSELRIPVWLVEVS